MARTSPKGTGQRQEELRRLRESHGSRDRLSPSRQLAFALGILMVTVAIGTGGYILIEGWSFGDAFYMTIISITTTGFMEVRALSEAGRSLTMVIILMGLASLAYLGGRAIQVLVERYLVRRRRMDRRIKRLKDHVIICGFGRMGRRVCEDISNAGLSFVVVESDTELVDKLSDLGYLYLIGDASSDEVLQEAGIDKARGLITVVSSDAENVFITLTAKALNHDIPVVTRAVNEQSEPKLRKAGADRVIKPYEVVGRRLAQLVIRPAMVEYIDEIARASGKEISIEEIQIGPGSSLSGVSLAEAPIRNEWNIIVVAIRREGDRLEYNPGPRSIIRGGDRIIAIGDRERLEQLTRLCVGKPPGAKDKASGVV